MCVVCDARLHARASSASEEERGKEGEGGTGRQREKDISRMSAVIQLTVGYLKLHVSFAKEPYKRDDSRLLKITGLFRKRAPTYHVCQQSFNSQDSRDEYRHT